MAERGDQRIFSSLLLKVFADGIDQTESHYLTNKFNRVNRLLPPAPLSVTHLPQQAAEAIRMGGVCTKKKTHKIRK